MGLVNLRVILDKASSLRVLALVARHPVHFLHKNPILVPHAKPELHCVQTTMVLRHSSLIPAPRSGDALVAFGS